MKALLTVLALFFTTAAVAAGPSPCYWSGSYVKCFPTAGLSSVDGTVSLPAYTFGANTNTGMYRIGTNDLGFATNGAVRLEVNTAGIVIGGNTTSDASYGTIASVTSSKVHRGSFSASYTGAASVGPYTVTYYESGGIVTLAIPAMSSATCVAGLFASGNSVIPASIVPLTTLSVPVFVSDSGASQNTPGWLQVTAAGAINLGKTWAGSGNFTAAASACGAGGSMTISYPNFAP